MSLCKVDGDEARTELKMALAMNIFNFHSLPVEIFENGTQAQEPRERYW